MYLKKSYFIFLLVGFLYSSCTGQMNFKVGYIVSYSQFGDTNSLLEQYNAGQPKLEQTLKPMHIMHGAHVGIRYKLSSGFGVELNWENVSNNKEAVGFDADDAVFTNKYFFSMTSLGAGFETYIGKFGYGASMDKTTFNIKTDIIGIDTKRKISSSSAYSSKFYLLYTIQESSSVSLVLKPHMQVPWGNYSLSLFEQEVSPNSPPLSLRERPWFFGLSILFYNGKHN